MSESTLLRAVYLRAVQDENTPASLLESAYTYANVQKDKELLNTLYSRESLPDSIFTRMLSSKSSTARVIAYQKSEVALLEKYALKENNEAALCALAARVDLSADLFQVITDRVVAACKSKVAYVLWLNAATPTVNMDALAGLLVQPFRLARSDDDETFQSYFRWFTKSFSLSEITRRGIPLERVSLLAEKIFKQNPSLAFFIASEYFGLISIPAQENLLSVMRGYIFRQDRLGYKLTNGEDHLFARCFQEVSPELFHSTIALLASGFANDILSQMASKVLSDQEAYRERLEQNAVFTRKVQNAAPEELDALLHTWTPELSTFLPLLAFMREDVYPHHFSSLPTWVADSRWAYASARLWMVSLKPEMAAYQALGKRWHSGAHGSLLAEFCTRVEEGHETYVQAALMSLLDLAHQEGLFPVSTADLVVYVSNTLMSDPLFLKYASMDVLMRISAKSIMESNIFNAKSSTSAIEDVTALLMNSWRTPARLEMFTALSKDENYSLHEVLSLVDALEN